MALMGLCAAYCSPLTEKSTPVKTLLTVAAVILGLTGLGLAIPLWGILPAVYFMRRSS